MQMQVQVVVNSARSLKNVNWRFGMLNPYAVVWIDTSRKCSTKVDMNNGMNPVWNEKFTIPLPPTSFPETAILCIDIVHANAPVGTKPLVGSTRFPLNAAINDARVHGQVSLCLNLTRPSGRPQGSIEINIGVKDPNIGQINQYNQQQTPYKQHIAASPLPQAQMQPQVGPYQPRPQVQPQFQPRPHVQLQGQFQPQPQVQPQGKFQPQPQVQPQGQIQPQPQVQPQGQFQARPQVQLQGQFRPQPQIQPHGQYLPQLQQKVPSQGQFQPQPMVKAQGQYQNQLQVQAQFQAQPRQNPKAQQQKPEAQLMNKQPNKPAPAQIRSQPRPNATSQQQKVQVQPMRKQPNKHVPVQTPNYSEGSVRQIPAQGPRNSMPPGTNRPQNRQGNPGPVRQQYNPAYGMGPGADGTRLTRDMLFVQNQPGQLSNNGNRNNAGQGGAGMNDNGAIKSTAADANADGQSKSSAVEADANGELSSTVAEVTDNGETMNTANAGNAVDESNAETTEGMNSAETFNDAESIQLSYEENQNSSTEREIGDYDYVEYAATEEYGHGGDDINASQGELDNGGYGANAGAECDNGANDLNSGAECDNEAYDVNAGAECNYGSYDLNAGVEYNYGAYDVNTGGEYDYGAYDVNAGDQECNYGGYDNSNDYVDEQYDGTFDAAGLDSHVESGEVDVSGQY